MLHKIKVFFVSIKRRGIINTIKMAVSEILYDKLNNINTSDIIELSKVTTKRENIKDCHEYCPSNQLILDLVFSYLNKHYDLEEKYFLDYGCGKGRVLIYAEQFKFKKIIGVEFASEFYNIAQQNIKVLKLENIEIFQEDATTFKIPNGVNIFYFYNPFVGQIMENVILNIEQHKKKYKEKILIIYVYPICKDMFISNGYHIVYEYKDEVIVFEK